MSTKKIDTYDVVVLTFVVADTHGETLDRHWATRPYAYIQGLGQMPPGFELGVRGLAPGDTFDFEVQSDQAYGAHNTQMVQKVDAAKLPDDLRVGAMIEMRVPGHLELMAFHVKAITEEVVHLDGNHPMAGKDLVFMGRVREVRPATSEEISDGRIRRIR